MYFPEPAELTAQSGWQDALWARQNLPELLHTTLLYPGLITGAITTYLHSKPKVEVFQSQQEGDSQSHAVRQIRLSANGQCCLLAASLMPRELLATYEWLNKLGDAPLGEAIEQHAGVQRNAFEIFYAAAGSPMAQNFYNGAETWARLYQFELPAGNITVVELFDPAFLKRLGQKLLASQENR